MKHYYLDKKGFTEGITDVDYTCRFCKRLWNKKIQEYHDLFFQRDTLLLDDVFEIFRNIYLQTYELDLGHFLTTLGLAIQATLRRAKVKLDLLTDINVLLMEEKGIRGICHSIYWYAKANNKYMKDCNKNKDSSYLQFWDADNLYGWAMSPKLSI